MKRILIILFIIGFAEVQADEIPFDTINIREVSVTAKRKIEERGLSISVIDSTIIRSHIHGSLSDLLSSNSTVFMKTYGQGALSTISFRGSSASHTKVTWNGIPLNNPMLGQVDFSLVPVNFTDKITLQHGGSSLQEGSGALGGSIHMESSPVWSDTYSINVAQGFGSFGTFKTHANLQLGKNRIRGKVRIFRESSRNNFTYQNTENGRWNYEEQENADYRKHGILGELFMKPNNNNFISLHTWFQDSDRNIPAIMSYEGAGRTETQDDEQVRISGIWKNYGQGFKSELTLGYSAMGIDYYLANQTGMGLFVNYNSSSKTHNAIASYKISSKIGSKLVLKSQANYTFSQAQIVETEEQTGYTADRQEIDMGLSVHRQFGELLSAFALVRAELSDYKLLPFMPSLGLEADIPGIKLKAITNVSRNYHLPTLNDLYWIPGGNPDLAPEEGYTADLSFVYATNNFQHGGFSMNLTGFASSINNWILWRPGDYSYWTAENIASVFARGLEYSMKGIYHSGDFKLSLLTTYSYTRTTNRHPLYEGDLSVDQQLIYIPIHKANGSINADYKGYHAKVSGSYIGERYTTSSNELTRHSLPGFALLDICTGKKMEFDKFSVSIQLKINNLLNKQYKAILSRPMPGRSYELMLRIDI